MMTFWAWDDLTARVDSHDDALVNNSAQVSALTDQLNQYQSDTGATITTLQGSYDVLHALGTAGVEEDYFWVGDDPALNTIKSVQISVYVQNGLSAGSSDAFASYFGLPSGTDIGDQTTCTPETLFYTYFTSWGRPAMPWNP